MEAWGSLVDCLGKSYFDEYLKNFEMACSCGLCLSIMCAKHG